jgi:hypothetical protein
MFRVPLFGGTFREVGMEIVFFNRHRSILGVGGDQLAAEAAT